MGDWACASLSFWSPLLDADLKPETLRRYRGAVAVFLAFVLAHGGAGELQSGHDFDYWLSYFAHSAYVTGSPSRGEVTKAVFGCEHWLPELGALRLARRSVKGWHRLVPPRPAAPMPRDLCFACAAVTALVGDLAEAIAMLLAFDCWLRISELAGLTAEDITDSRGAADWVNRGVSVFLRDTKTGRRQAVQIEDPGVIELVVAWAAAVRRTQGPQARLFPAQTALRAALARALRAFDDGQWDTRGLAFVWHSFRHGGASRAHLAGVPLPAILVRGRWAVESSGRHYIQAGRQLLLTLELPGTVADLAARLQRAGLVALLAPAPALRARLSA